MVKFILDTIKYLVLIWLLIITIYFVTGARLNGWHAFLILLFIGLVQDGIKHAIEKVMEKDKKEPPNEN
jgi:hypothetical protein